jgi:hypothetical protein
MDHASLISTYQVQLVHKYFGILFGYASIFALSTRLHNEGE